MPKLRNPAAHRRLLRSGDALLKSVALDEPWPHNQRSSHGDPGYPMKHFVTGLGLSIAFALSTAAAQTWKEYVFNDDGFAISAPSEPELKSQPINVAGGTADAHVYTTAVAPDIALMLFVFQRDRADRRTTAQFHEQAQQGSLDAVNGKLRKRLDLMLGKFAGVELEFEAQHPELDTRTHQVRCQYFVVGRKIFHLIAIAPMDAPFPDEAERWLKSFRLTTAADH
ncbi:MAG: hypothetical protein WB505_18990 [Pseudolabrys sp.]